MHITRVSSENAEQEGFLCIKNKKAAGFRRKLDWIHSHAEAGPVVFLAKDEKGKQQGFAECIPAENAWRPVKAEGFLFIHCIMVQSKSDRSSGIGSALISACEEEAIKQNKIGLCVMTSEGTWMTGRELFEKNGYQKADSRDRFDLMYKAFDESKKPVLKNWQEKATQYSGWHLFYADQCPWHINAVEAMDKTAKEEGVAMQMHELKTPGEAQHAPSGFGTFALIHNGEILEDHYISKTRFRTIIKKLSS